MMSRSQITARTIAALKLVLLALFLVLTNHGLYGRVQAIGAHTGLLVFAFIWLVFLAGYVGVAYAPDKRIRYFWGAVFCVSAFGAEFYFLASGGTPLSIIRMESLLDARGDWNNAVTFYPAYFLVALGKSAIGFAGIALPARPWPWKSGRVASRAALGLPLLPMLMIAGILYMRGGEGATGLPVQVTAVTELGLLVVHRHFGEEEVPRERVPWSASSAPGIDNVVVIMDESVRGDYLDINHPNGIPTGLRAQGPRVANFGYASSASNCSAYSNAVLRFGGTYEDLPGAIRKNPSIWAFARNAGFSTYLIEGQQYKLTEMDFIDVANIDKIYSREDLLDNTMNEFVTDINAVGVIGSLIAGGGRKLVYFVKQGAHFPYEKNYPPEFRPYQPFMSRKSILAPQNQVLEDRPLVENSYRNALAWGVGEFMQALLKLDLSRTVIIYTSDHGQKLADDQEESFFTHCNTTRVHPAEGLVPLFVITDNPRLAEEFKAAAAKNFGRASHLNVYPTVLSLLGYEQVRSSDKYGKPLFATLDGRQQFVAPPFFGRYGRAPKWTGIESGAVPGTGSPQR